MSTRRKFLLIFVVILILGVLAAVAYSRSEIVRDAVYGVWRTSSSKIDALVQSAAIIGLALVLGSVWLRKRGPALEVKPAVRQWLIGFFVAMLMVSSFILIVNPRDMYPLRFFPNRLLASHRNKVERYPGLTYAPDIVVIGSSRARAINDEHMQSALGLRLYNAAVSSGGILDAVTYARFMDAAAATATPFPSVLLVEVTPGAVREVSQRASAWPPAIFPYMDSDMLMDALNNWLFGVVSIARLSESFIILQNTFNGADWAIHSDGSVSRSLVTAAEMNALVDERIEINRNASWCEAVDGGFSASVEQIIDIAHTQHSAIIFYYSPRQPRFYDETMRANLSYQQCEQAYSAYLNGLSQTYENVFFVDYINPDTLHLESSPEHFFDEWHVTPAAANLMIDDMAALIRRAYDVAAALEAQP